MANPAPSRRAFLMGGVTLCALVPPALASGARWGVLQPGHPMWAEGLDGVALQMPDGSSAMLLLRPNTNDAVASVAFPGKPGQSQLISTLNMPGGGAPQLKIADEDLVSLPAPQNGFAAYGFIIDAEDFALLQAGLTWNLTTPSETIAFPLTGSQVAIAEALMLRDQAGAPETVAGGTD